MHLAVVSDTTMIEISVGEGQLPAAQVRRISAYQLPKNQDLDNDTKQPMANIVQGVVIKHRSTRCSGLGKRP